MIKVRQSTYTAIKAMLKNNQSVEFIHMRTRTSIATVEAIKNDRVEVLPTKSARKEEPSDVFFRF